MPEHFDSVFTPGARSADAASRSKFQKALSGCLVLRVERYELKPVLDAQGRPLLAPKKDAEGRPVLGPDGQRVLVEQTEAVGVYGTTCCTGKKVYMRLSTEEELKADGYAKSVSNRNSINVIRLGASEVIVRGRRGEMADPGSLPPDQRPLWRCEGSTALRDARGGLRTTPDGYAEMRCRWISAYCNFQDKAGRQVDLLSHISTDKYATLSVSLRSDRDQYPSAVNYYGIFADSVKSSAQQRGVHFEEACRKAAQGIIEAWQQQGGKGQPEHFGRLAVTTWNPDMSLRFDFGGPQEAECQRRLVAFLADPKFQNVWKTDSQGIERERRSFCQPEFLVRLLNGKGEICGAARVRPWTFANRQRDLAAEGRSEEASLLGTPEGKAAWITALGRQPMSGGMEEIRGLDVLCGECSRVGQVYENTSTFGSQNDSQHESTIQQTRRMLRLALGHTQSILPRRGRLNIGCSQCFICYNADGIVNGFYQTSDAIRYRNAVLLGPKGETLACSPRFASELNEENRLRSDLAYALSVVHGQAQAQSQSQAQAQSKTQGQTQAQGQAQAQSQSQAQEQPVQPLRSEAPRPAEGQTPAPDACQTAPRPAPASPGEAAAPQSEPDDEGFRPGF